jgi:hypothetical protein
MSNGTFDGVVGDGGVGARGSIHLGGACSVGGGVDATVEGNFVSLFESISFPEGVALGHSKGTCSVGGGISLESKAGLTSLLDATRLSDGFGLGFGTGGRIDVSALCAAGGKELLCGLLAGG